MEKYLMSEPVPIRKPFRWSWFVFGCGCLIVGAAYLSTVTLSGGGVAQGVSDGLASVETDQ
ncbi:MAG: hypothetical protein AAF635_03560 [Cyanobacteria bacterium P01_C01_bin.69]